MTGVLVVVIKRFVGAPRPLHVLGPERIRVLLEPLHFMSFPSGHSATAAALAVWAGREPSARIRWWPWLFAFLCGLSRVYVGAHWVTDVVGGWLLGIGAAAAICHLWPSPRGPSNVTAGACAGPVQAATAGEATEVDPCA